MKRLAFTMMELIFVLIVIGILSVLAMPSFNRDPLAEATEQLANHIRYTQHLAMLDDRFDPVNPQWYSEMWSIFIRQVHDVNNGGDKEWYYEVFSDRFPYNGDSTLAEEATDPLTGETLGNGSFNNTVDDNKIINLTRKYGIQNIVFTGGMDNKNSPVTTRRITFDNLGRPYRSASWAVNDNWRDFLIQTNLTITLTGHDNRQAVITVIPETGYVSTYIPG
ncbi:MAG: type II/IV secretion system protein [Sulfuricurvum sp.]|uniref:pilus assembly FimT family protein n=1 Tax=Sulfuricurvum sp. TaxID=2025608 RepID=UPI0026390FC4|nr:type II/IV secretion system protein [Sulfuricurvum sp.]MDD5119619.1 type II/IV secretion system protein [Sulfuricurvum sp.]